MTTYVFRARLSPSRPRDDDGLIDLRRVVSTGRVTPHAARLPIALARRATTILDRRRRPLSRLGRRTNFRRRSSRRARAVTARPLTVTLRGSWFPRNDYGVARNRVTRRVPPSALRETNRGGRRREGSRSSEFKSPSCDIRTEVKCPDGLTTVERTNGD